MKKPLIITTGDADGIGVEVCLKALKSSAVPLSRPLVVFTPSKKYRKKFSNLKSRPWIFVKHFEEAQDVIQSDSRSNVLVESPLNPALWVEQAAKYCSFTGSALVTGPLSKGLILEAGLKDMGHTGILKRVTNTQDVFMTFVGRHLRVMLATDHIALHQVAKNIGPNQIRAVLRAALQFRSQLPPRERIKPLALLGLNPHAGENGLIGKEEESLIEILKTEEFKAVKGPLVPDAAFKPNIRKQYSVHIALYHDQGLIPFKSLHGDSGVHITWGLPFIRTSVDHGTAKDIFGKGLADPASMFDALRWAHRNLN